MNIQPLAAYRYNPARVGSLSDVVAPPYDVISPELQDELYAKHPNNVVRLILNKILDCDDESDNRYIRSAKTLKQWKDEGVLQRENAEAIYVYHQIYNVAGKDYVRKGFMCRCEAVPFGEGMVFPHEETMSGPKMDRLMLTTACKMNFSQIFGLYPDSENEIQNILENAIAGQTPIEATDHLGVTHRMWVVTDPAVISQVVAKMGPKPIFIADGHHRYETACNYRKQIRQTGALTADHPANYVLMVCVAMEDPGLIVLPTHRLFRGMAAMTQAELIEKLGNCFRVTTVGDGAIIAEKAWTLIEQLNDQGTMALYTGGDGRWSLIQITDAGRAKMAQIASDHHPEWQALGVAILHRLVIETLLDVRKPEKPKYVHTVKEVVEDLRANPKEFPMAALVMPATVGHIQELSMLRERMPPKSTYFYPKLITGFVFNPLE
ncbi:MAG: DUF1015 domain-containing protein [Thermoguttaceae bacterium]|nr:DUF1015 domain-containing protein [Thermoguttaceae bacterium]